MESMIQFWLVYFKLSKVTPEFQALSRSSFANKTKIRWNN